MPRRRNRVKWWRQNGWLDDRRYGDQPFNFMHREYLTALGVAHETDDESPMSSTEEFVIDPEGLAGYELPPDATDALLLTITDGDSARVRISPHGTRIDPVAARWLWDQREEAELLGVLTSSAWCTFCGRHFIDQRAKPGSGHRMARRCKACRRTKGPEQLRECAADDCENYFRPGTGRGLFCKPSCKEAQRVRDR